MKERKDLSPSTNYNSEIILNHITLLRRKNHYTPGSWYFVRYRC